MNKKEFAEGLRARTDEIQQMENMVQKYSQTLGSKSYLLKTSMVVAYRRGIVDLLGFLDERAIAKKNERDAQNKLLTDTRG